MIIVVMITVYDKIPYYGCKEEVTSLCKSGEFQLGNLCSRVGLVFNQSPIANVKSNAGTAEGTGKMNVNITETYARDSKIFTVDGKAASNFLGMNVYGGLPLTGEVDNERYSKNTTIDLDVIIKFTKYAFEIIVLVVVLIAAIIMYKICQKRSKVFIE